MSECTCSMNHLTSEKTVGKYCPLHACTCKLKGLKGVVDKQCLFHNPLSGLIDSSIDTGTITTDFGKLILYGENHTYELAAQTDITPMEALNIMMLTRLSVIFEALAIDRFIEIKGLSRHFKFTD